jgi:hypothetical protein
MPEKEDRRVERDERVSIPLGPEEALRALLAVKPDESAPEHQDDEQGHARSAHGDADGEDDPAR